jgi:hypothetical protein
MASTFAYDMAISFAGKQRDYARAVAACMKELPVTQQDQEIRTQSGLPAPFDLAETYLQGLLIQTRFIAHAPAQINGLKPSFMFPAKIPQMGERPSVQRIALLLQIAEGGTNENPECLAG